jgi:Dual specificity phosphatase, catalytic domain
VKVFWVSKRLAFGSAITTWGHVEKLQALGVTHVINLRHGKHGKKIRQFKSLWLPFRDDMKSRPRWYYRRALKFYKKAMRKPNAKVLIICHHGRRRSPSLAYFLLRGASGFSHSRAQNAVLRARPSAIVARPYRESGEIFLALEWAYEKYSGNAKS